MKKLFLLVAVLAMLLPSCKKINEAIDGLDNRLDKLEQETIPSIDEQISAINTTLGNLDAMDKELKGYIDNLTTTASSLQEQINATNIKIDEVKAELKNDITSTEDELKEEIETAKANVIAQLEAAKEAMENELATINVTIATLQAKDIELEGKITELRNYVDTELGDTTDWVNATFATLEQYNALVTEVATIKEQIKAINQSITELETRLTTKINEDIANAVSTLNADMQQKVSEITSAYTTAIKSAKEEITAAYTSAIQNVINALDVSLKAWVGEQLANYYTIAEVEAKITALQTVITEGDASLQEELSKLNSQLETTANEITAAYKKAIEEAITTNNGVIDTKIANEIASVNQRITNEVATINAKIAEIESRLDNVEAKIAELLARIQSVSYIPTYDDGKATVKCNGNTSRVTLDFEVSPKDAVVELAKVWQSAVSVKAIYTQTRAVSFIDMPIVKFESDPANGVISVTASGENMSAEFFNGTQSASARLSISDGNNSVVSEYVPMVAKEVIIPNNEIWYTSSNGNVVTPYATDAFNANIVSNTYDAEKECWVIKFDGNVTKISYRAFYYCSSLTSVTIPDSVTTIGDYAFRDCTSLTSVNIPDSVTSIGDCAFYDCTSLTSVTIPDSVTTIGSSTFLRCTSLTSVTIPDSVTTIGYYAFQDCSSLTSVTIPDSVTTIRDCAFQDCSMLQEFKGKFASDDGRCLIQDGTLIAFAPEGLTEYAIPDSVTTIGSSAFEGCSSLTSVTIPDSVTSIGSRAFYECTSLESVTIPDSVTSIGNYAFEDCDSLTSVTIGKGVTSIGSYAFSYCTSLTSVTIPDSVTSIGSDAFQDCTSLTSVTIGNGVTTIGYYAFEGCTSLTSVTIPDSVTTIRDDAFHNCTSLTSVTIPDSVTSIGDDAFGYCTSLISVTIPDSVTSIGDYAFYGCLSLKEVYCKPTTPPTGGSSMFTYNVSGRKIYVPSNSVSAYKSASGWSDYSDKIFGYNF